MRSRCCFLLVILLASSPLRLARAEKPMHVSPACLGIDTFFENEVWAKVGERVCLKCHNPEGKAAKTTFLLRDSARNRNAISLNQLAFVKVGKAKVEGESKLLTKVLGGLDHGGGVVLAPNSTGYKILERFVTRLGDKPNPMGVAQGSKRPFFEGVVMLSPDRLLRRITLSLGARLPTGEERAQVGKQGADAIPGILRSVMNEQAFYDRLKEGFEDIFLTKGYEGNGEEALSYEHFEKTRLWYQKHDLRSIPDKEKQKRERWRLAAVYRDAMRREPLEMIEYIVRNGRPFTELVTADYILVSPYTSRGYGVFDRLRTKFDDADDPFEYLPVKLLALKARNGKRQKSATGYYPHSGLLSQFQYLRRYPTTETNRNRLRARMYYQHFLGVDVMALAPRVTDAAATTVKYEVPTMQAPDCVVCHKSVDPLAGLFQDYNKEGHVGPRREGWYADMFAPGFEGEKLPESDRWRALQWLGERTAKDPRFATAMVEHVSYILMGRKVLQAPEDIDDPRFSARRRAYQEQRQLIEEAARRFMKADFDLKVAFEVIVGSKFYTADGLATATKNPDRAAELDDVGLVRLLTPEQLERKITAVFGQEWGRLHDRDSKFGILYGGIDSKEVTERITDPSGAMGATQRILSNDVACKNVALDFTRKPSERLLFPGVEPDDVPDESAEAKARVLAAIAQLHDRILGQRLGTDHAEIRRTYGLFVGILADARKAKGLDKRASYFCGRVDKKRLDDPHYTIRAWRGVVTYLLRQYEFLYE